MNSETPNDLLDQRLDALLAGRALAPRADFADDVLRALETGDALDQTLDERLRFQPLRAHARRTETLFRGVLRAVQIQKIIRWSTPAFAALIAGVIALPVFLQTHSTLPADELVAQAMAEDPALAAMLRGQTTTAIAPFVLDHETVEVVAGLNDNALAWLETLTYYE